MSRTCEQLSGDLFAPRATDLGGGFPDGLPTDICILFERLALEVWRSGFERYSARALIHQIRWHEQIEKGNREFKINNNGTPAMARWFLKRHPEMAGFFELRGDLDD